MLSDAPRIDRLRFEPWVVLIGRPNAGKSTLLNTLARQHRAVVSPASGTTRDALSAPVVLPRGIIQLIDIAGLEHPADHPVTDHAAPDDAAPRVPSPDAASSDVPTPDPASTDPASPDATAEIARQMQARAHTALELADVRLGVIEQGDIRPPVWEERGITPSLVVTTKCDSGPHDRGAPITDASGQDEHMFAHPGEQPGEPTLGHTGKHAGDHTGGYTGGHDRLSVSAHSGFGIDALRQRLDQLCFGSPQARAQRRTNNEADSTGSGRLVLNARHVQAVTEARAALARAIATSPTRSELIAAELRTVLDQLGSIGGVVAPDDVLGLIFAGFCIGK